MSCPGVSSLASRGLPLRGRSVFLAVGVRWRTVLPFVGYRVCMPDFVPVSALWCLVGCLGFCFCRFPLWRVGSGFRSVSSPACWFRCVVSFLVSPGLPGVPLWGSWPALLGVAPVRVRLIHCPVPSPGRSSLEVATQVALCPAGVSPRRGTLG